MKKAELGRRIRNYLFLNNGITLPGIGSFEVAHIDQYLSNNESVIHPPFSKIRFHSTTHSTGPDELKRYVYDDELESQLEVYFQNVINDVLNFGESHIDGIGNLRKNKHEEFYLVSNDLIDYENMYLPRIDTSKFKVAKLVDKQLSEKPRATAILKEKKSFKTSTLSSIGNSVQTKSSIRTQYWPFAIAGGLLMLLLSAFFIRRCFHESTSYNTEQREILMTVPEGNEERVKIEMNQSNSEIVSSDVGIELKTEESPIELTGQREINCMIVLGSFSELRNAQNLEQKMIGEGYSMMIKSNNNRHRVGVATSCDESEMGENLKEIRILYESNAWIL